MKREVICVAKTVEEAIEKGLKELGVTADAAEHEILEQPKKGFLGFGEVLAKVKVSCETTGEDKAVEFVKTLLGNMEIQADVEVRDTDDGGRRIVIVGEDAGMLIGHHGETLDALQYLVNLTANRAEGEEKNGRPRLSVDIENYREKREDALRSLARRMAGRVRRSGRAMSLEPMNPYERRIIHSEVQKIDGVTTYSVGQDDDRKIVISPEDKVKTGHRK